MRRGKDGRWGFPENLGGKINTLGNEETPFIHPDGVTLYFRSDGHVGMGGFDLYKTVYDPSIQEWSIPHNLGYPINTEGDEGGLFISLDGTEAYYATDEGKDNTDIYRFDLYEEARPLSTTFLRGRVFSAEDSLATTADVVLEYLGDSTSTTYSTDSEGEFLITLPVGKHYGISVEKAGYLFYAENIQLDSVRTISDPFIWNIYLAPLETPSEDPVTAPVVLNNIFFDTGSATLLSKSDPELDRLAELLQEQSTANIEIIGHTDDVGEESDNLSLSIARARAVYDALQARNIPSARMSYVGKGESEPIAPNDTQEGRQKNRRTEFRLIY